MQDDPELLARAVARFSSKDVVFILGDADSCNCNTPDYVNPTANVANCYPDGGTLPCVPSDYGGIGCCDTYPDAVSSNALDVTCQAMVQGSNRIQRGLNYIAYVSRQHD